MTSMSLTIPTLADIIQPARGEHERPRPIGTIHAGAFTGHLMGYLLHHDELVAVLFGAASKAAREALWAAAVKGRLVEFQLDGPRPRHIRPKRVPGKEVYERFDHDGPLPASNGHPLLLIYRAALTEYLANPPEKSDGWDHFITFGPAGADRPYAFWLTQLRQLVLLPELPGWAEVVWEAAAGEPSLKLVEKVGVCEGFAPAWRVRADTEAWRGLYTRLAKAKKLPLPERSVLAPAAPPQAEWSLRDFHGRGGRT
jgi:hypothetical protein